ncbi:hypothetical protein CHLNCDRAFT_132944 [Chlorella variabilis]|uniref:EamA domain-containing protein n=1 Tax=Chlorella variabilis TaxID=554065 RepID=E1Z203_CHLVA|nr:hypothetical protein CHLNCDRAFT_132944 [Chlorella variabilis]EFN59580.1 hypothetical protein CHLNCDRAFT_132944 [Chlorella variabilis]|eukprot:XP_005851682.1 hypothetical protein CHLNCDRAFT_132944 [Chlorella variabilis]
MVSNESERRAASEGRASDDEENAPLISDGPQQQGEACGAAAREGGSASITAPSGPPVWRRPLAALWDNGVACGVVSSLSFTLASTLVKLVQHAIPVFEIILCRALFAGVTTVLSCRAKGLPIFGSTAPLPIKLARGIVGATAMICCYESIVRLPLSDSTVIFFLSPAFTAILGYLLLGEKFGWLTAAGCSASLGGVVMVAQPGSAAVDWSRQRLLGMVFGFAGAVLAAGAYICIRQIGKREHPLTIAMYFHTFSFLGSVVPLCLGYPQPAVLPSPVQAVLLLLLAACSFTANLLVNRAFQIELAAKASAVNFSQVIFAWTIGTVFFDDPLTVLSVVGTCLIATGVIVVNLDKMGQKHQLGTTSDAAGGADKDTSQQQEQSRGWSAAAA